VAELSGQAAAETIQLALEYAPAPPFQSGTPGTAPAAVLAAARARLASSRAEREALIAAVTAAPMSGLRSPGQG
jgi:cyclohexyl-isocyanide hydratase